MLECPGLPPQVASEIIASTSLYRDPESWLLKLDKLREDQKLPGLAVWFTFDQGLPPLPGPIRDPFEPMLLDGRANGPLQALLDGQRAFGTHELNWIRSGNRWRARTRWFSLVLLLLWSGYGVMQGTKTGRFMSEVVSSGVAALVILSLVMVFLLVHSQWLLIPQGVLLRRGFAVRRRSLERYLSGDSTLLITPRRSSWDVQVCRAGRVRSTTLNDRAVLALLAAWQSPARAPEFAELVDYA